MEKYDIKKFIDSNNEILCEALSEQPEKDSNEYANYISDFD